MKAVILARGRGTRMRRQDGDAALTPAQAAMADRGLKAMIPFRRPFLDYVLSALADAGCGDVRIIVGPDDDVIRPYYGGRAGRVRVSFGVQDQPLGTADAVLATEAFAADDPFLVLNSDNYYPVTAYRAMTALDGPGLPVFRRSTLVERGNIDPDRVRSFAIVTVRPDGFVHDIVEPPEASMARDGDPLVSMNCWRFDRRIFEACRAIAPSPRGELEIPNAVRHAVRALGVPFRAVAIEEGVLDLSRRSDIPEVARRLTHIEPAP